MDKDPIDELKNLPPEYVERFKARRAERQARMAGMNEEFARKFKFRDSVHFSYRTPQGNLDPKSDIFTIAQWSDDEGNTVYVQKGSKEDYPPEDRIKALSDRIKAQQEAFNALDPAEQTRIKAAPTLPGNQPDNRFSDYLKNVALAAQFQKLK